MALFQKISSFSPNYDKYKRPLCTARRVLAYLALSKQISVIAYAKCWLKKFCLEPNACHTKNAVYSRLLENLSEISASYMMFFFQRLLIFLFCDKIVFDKNALSFCSSVWLNARAADRVISVSFFLWSIEANNKHSASFFLWMKSRLFVQIKCGFLLKRNLVSVSGWFGLVLTSQTVKGKSRRRF